MLEKKKGKSHKEIVSDLSKEIYESGMLYMKVNELAYRGA